MITRRGTFSTADSTADQEYKKKLKDVRAIMKSLEQAIDKHVAGQKKDPGDWGQVGDMGYIYRELVDLVDFIK